MTTIAALDEPTQRASHRARLLRVRVSDAVSLAVSDFGPRNAEHTVVLLHGFCLSQAMWAGQVDYLLRRYPGSVRVISYDHRGHGQSGSAPMRTYSIAQCAADLAALLEVLAVAGTVTLVGHSMGAMVAIAYQGLAHRPVEASGLVLIATAARRLTGSGLGRLLGSPATGVLFELINHTPQRPWRALSGPVAAVLRRLHSHDVRRQTVAAVTAAALSSTPVSTAVGFLPSLRGFDTFHVLGSIRAHTTVVSGGADLLTPPAHAVELAAAIPGCRHVHVPAGGHMLCQQAPHVVNSAIATTIRRAAATPKAAAPHHRTCIPAVSSMGRPA
ncbi:alpha/beta fold hydrolase [Mycobacterium xenopi]|uniref:alpha/beta fold hydrolase n=1 Tax=Mycobacterium xenopi TaxID=1789 RepID=UPI000A169BB0|nr:alpha/beta hydrolase [Mycobacterium xenopi]SPX94938.1 putative hydrolase or acyltransferase of alpha/beta superfamily [Mycobacterium xenopi]